MSEQVHDCRDIDCLVMTPHSCCGGPGCETCRKRRAHRVASPGALSDLRAKIERLECYDIPGSTKDYIDRAEVLALLGAAQEQP